MAEVTMPSRSWAPGHCQARLGWLLVCSCPLILLLYCCRGQERGFSRLKCHLSTFFFHRSPWRCSRIPAGDTPVPQHVQTGTCVCVLAWPGARGLQGLRGGYAEPRGCSQGTPCWRPRGSITRANASLFLPGSGALVQPGCSPGRSEGVHRCWPGSLGASWQLIICSAQLMGKIHVIPQHQGGQTWPVSVMQGWYPALGPILLAAEESKSSFCAKWFLQDTEMLLLGAVA